MKRYLWIGLVMALMLSLALGCGQATEGQTAVAMTLGQEATATYQYGCEAIDFSFTPAENGFYYFEVDPNDVRAWDYPEPFSVWLMDGNGNTIASHVFIEAYEEVRLGCYLEKNQSYVWRFWGQPMRKPGDQIYATVKRCTDKIYLSRGEYIWQECYSRTTLAPQAVSTDGSPLSYTWYRTDYAGNRTLLACTEPECTINGVIADESYICRITAGNETKEVYFEINYWGDRFYIEQVEQRIQPEADDESVTLEVTPNNRQGTVTYQWYLIQRNVNESGELIKTREAITTGGTGKSLTVSAPFTQTREYECEAKLHINGATVATAGTEFTVVRNDVMLENAGETTEIDREPGEAVTLEVSLQGNTTGVTLEWYKGLMYYGDETEITRAKDQTTLTINDGDLDGPYITISCNAYDAQGIMISKVYYYIYTEDGFECEYVGESYKEIDGTAPATFEVSASATKGTSPAYQWYRREYCSPEGSRWVPIEGANQPTYTEENVMPGGYTYYACQITGGYHKGDVWTFTVNHKETEQTTQRFAAQVVSTESGESFLKVDKGANVTMQAETFGAQAGSTLTYQWLRVEGDILETISGATGAEYTVTNVQKDMEFYCRVSDGTNSDLGHFSIYLEEGQGSTLKAVVYGTTEATQKTITVQPETSVEMQVSASGGTGNYTYEWSVAVPDDYTETRYRLNGTGATYQVEHLITSATFICTVRDGTSYTEVFFVVNMDSGLTAEADGPTAIAPEPDDPGDWPVVLSVTAGSSQNRPFTYKWTRSYTDQYDNEKLSYELTNATTGSYTITNAAGGIYTCTVSDGYTTIRIPFTVTIDNQFSTYRTADPNQYVKTNNAITLEAGVSCLDDSRVTYKWVKGYSTDGMSLGIGKTLTITGFSTEKSGTYRCIVTDDISGIQRAVEYYVQLDSGLTVSFHAGNQVIEDEGKLEIQAGVPVTINVTATNDTGDPIRYTWYYYDENGMYKKVDCGQNGELVISQPVTRRWYCHVNDGTRYLYFSFYLDVDSGLMVRSANEDETTTFLVEPDELPVLKVAAKNNVEGSQFTYQWSKETRKPDIGWVRENINGATGNTLAVETVENAMYYCQVGDGYNFATLVFHVNINSHLTASVSAGQTYQIDEEHHLYVSPHADVTLTTTASSLMNQNISYQWYQLQYNSEWGYSYYSAIDGATAASYSIEDVSANQDYYVSINDGYMNIDRYVYIRIDSGLSAEAAGGGTITAEPNEEVTLAVTASCTSGDEPTYQWYQYVLYTDDNGDLCGRYDAVPGETSSDYTFTAVAEKDYYCLVSDPYGASEEVFFRVYIDSGLTAKAAVRGITAKPEEEVTLTVNASCKGETGPTYQWYQPVLYTNENGEHSYYYEVVPDETGSSYTFIPAFRGEYYCTVSDPYGYTADVYFYVSIDTGLDVRRVNNYTVYVDPNGSTELQVLVRCQGNVTLRWDKQYYIDGEWTYPETISSATTETLTISNVEDPTYIICCAEDEYGNQATESFMLQPQTDFYIQAKYGIENLYTAPGGNVTLGVETFGLPEGLTYTWFKTTDDATIKIQDATGPDYTTEAITKKTQYSCVVDWGDDNRQIMFTVHIDSGFSVSQISQRDGVLTGNTDKLQVSASIDEGGELTYAWYRNGTLLTGETTDTLTVSEGGRYWCNVRSNYGDSERYEFYRFEPAGTALTAETPVTLTIEEEQPLKAYAFTPAVTGTYYFTSESENDTYASLMNPAGVIIDSDDDSGIRLNFLVYYELAAGQTYYVAPRYLDGNRTGSFTIRVTVDPVLERRKAAFSMYAGQTLRLETNYEGWSGSIPDGSGSHTAISVDESRMTVTGLAAGTETVTVVYSQSFVTVYTITVLPKADILKLPAGLNDIEADAFSGDSSVRFVEFTGDEYTTIADGAFAGSGIVQIIVPNGNVWFGANAFGSLKPAVVCPRDTTTWYCADNCGLVCLEPVN